MWRPIHVPLIVLALQSPADALEMRWPDPNIAVPPLVQQFIVGECREDREMSLESLDACILGERHGYRAVVSMLTDGETAELTAARYRACRNGLGTLGGRFHRNRATCIAASLGQKWRFELSQEAAVRGPAEQSDIADGGWRVASSGE